MTRSIKSIAIVVVIWAMTFSYGYLVGKLKIFPYALIAPIFGSLDPEPEGRWQMRRPPQPGTSREQLAALPYLAGYKSAGQNENVTLYQKQYVWDGLNLYTSGHETAAYLMDMKGRQIFTWHFPFDRIWPDLLPRPMGWRRVHLFENGDILAITDYTGIIKIDKNSRLLWAYPGGCHHDLFIGSRGEIYVLTYKKRLVPSIHPTIPVVEDFITILGPDGKERDSLSLLEMLEGSPYSYLMISLTGKEAVDNLDILHANTVEVFDGSLAGLSSIYRRGNILIALRNISLIAILDPDAHKIVWAYGPNNLVYPHQPTLLDNGNLLIFDNGHDSSRVIELNPLTRRIVWEYSAADFFSSECGSNQRLPNGNTLITESDGGRAFEVTPSKKIVWEFYNPHRAGPKDELIATLYELIRVQADLPFLRE